jgi:hypothetical protein
MTEEIQELIKAYAERQEFLRSQGERETKYIHALAALTRDNSRLETENIRLESELCALQCQVAGDII